MTLVVVITDFVLAVTTMTLGELKQLNEKLLKQVQGENFSILFVLGLWCFVIKKRCGFKKETLPFCQLSF